MTFEEKMAAIDQYFDNITSEEFNELLEKKYGIPNEESSFVNEGDDFPKTTNLFVERLITKLYHGNCSINVGNYFSDACVEDCNCEDSSKAA